MSQWGEENFDRLVNQLINMTESVKDDQSINNFDLRRTLKFISKVILVVEQAYQDVLSTLIEFKYITDDDLSSGRLIQLTKELELIQSRSRYRDAEEICSRLHHLGDYYEQEIKPIIDHLPNKTLWREVFYLFDEYEGRIIMMVKHSFYELIHLISRSNREEIVNFADLKVEKIRNTLSILRSLNSRILGLSGNTGLLEMTEDREALAKKSLYIHRGDIQMGDKIETKIGSISNVSGQLFIGKFNDVIANLNNTGQNDLAEALKSLKEAILASQTIPDEQKKEQIEVINQVGEEAAKPSPNKTLLKMLGSGLLTTLKTIPDLIKVVGTVAPFIEKLYT